MDIVTRSEAIVLGQRWYFTGACCPQGHVAKRSVSNSECRACVNARRRQKRVTDPSGLRARDRARQGPKRNEQSRASRARNLTKRRSYDRVRNAEPVRLASIVRRSREYAKRHPGRVNALTAKRRARLARATPSWLDERQLVEIRGLYELAQELGPGWEVDHIVPIRSPLVCGLHVPWNLRVIPTTENRRKGNRLVLGAADETARLYERDVVEDRPPG
jgi:hypothetical protein